MKPFKFGDKIDGDWERYDICPVCEAMAGGRCKCLYVDTGCPNGHEWYYEFTSGTIQPGISPGHREAYPEQHQKMMEIVNDPH